MTFRFSFFISLLLCFAVTSSLPGQVLYTDDFNDGVANGWLEEDLNDPSFGPGIFDASSGAYELAVAGAMPAGFAGSHGTLVTWEPTVAAPIQDGYFQGTVRADTHGSTVSLLSRADPAAGTDYGFFASTLHGTFGIEVFDASKPEPQTILGLMDPSQFSFSAGEDWIIKGGTIGDQITMKVWRPGQPEPVSPQLTFTDTTFQSGALCLITYADVGLMTEPVIFSGTFDNLSFTAVPEPSTAALGICGLVLLAVMLKRMTTNFDTKDHNINWIAFWSATLAIIATDQMAHAQVPPGRFTDIRNLGPSVNSGTADAVPQISSDGLTLYFASNRSGGEGRFDLYQATRPTVYDEFSEVMNLGPGVNSPDLDIDRTFRSMA